MGNHMEHRVLGHNEQAGKIHTDNGGPMSQARREIIAFAVLILLALATAFLSGERGMEAASYQAQITALEERIAALEGKPLVQSKYTTVNHFRGLAEVQVRK